MFAAVGFHLAVKGSIQYNKTHMMNNIVEHFLRLCEVLSSTSVIIVVSKNLSFSCILQISSMLSVVTKQQQRNGHPKC